MEVHHERLTHFSLKFRHLAMREIRIKKSKVGTLRKALNVKPGEKIPLSKLRVKPGDSPAIKKKKIFALNARKWNKGKK